MYFTSESRQTTTDEHHRWRVTGEFTDILIFLGEFMMNRVSGEEMRLYSKQLYENDDGVVFHFSCNWDIEQMGNALNHHCEENLCVYKKFSPAIRSSLVYLGTPTNPRNEHIPTTPQHGD